MYTVIRKPLVSEKNSMLAEHGVYVFETDKQASKVEIKNAVEKLFRVKVKSVRTAVCRSRTTRSRGGVSATKYWKKAMVRLVPGEKIAMFEGA
jgi:large subunit ribosomal protein L23